MRFRRLTRLIVARKWLILAVALVMATAVGVWSQLHNQRVRPLYEALATVTFVTAEGGRSETSSLVEPLNAAAEIAEAANSDAITGGTGRVDVDERAGTLRLIARADQEQEAIAAATEMREGYFRAASEEGEAVLQARLDEIVAEASDLFDRLEELQPREPAETTLNEADQARLDFISAQVDALTQRSSQLFVDLILAQTGDDGDRVGNPEEIQEELDVIEAQLEELYVEIAALDPTGGVGGNRPTTPLAPPTESTTSRDPSDATQVAPSDDLQRDWTIQAIQGRIEELQLEYEEVFVNLGNVESTEEVSTTAGPVVVSDMTDPRLPILLLAAIGLVGGALVGTGIAFAEDRLRRRLLVAGDVPSSRLLAELPSFRLTLLQTHDRSKPSASRVNRLAMNRLQSVKALRQSVVGLAGQWGRPAIIGIGGSRVDHAEVEALALELALSVAATDRTVLLLDLDFRSEPEVIGDGSETSVATILSRLRQNGGVSTTELESVFLGAVPMAPHLRVITSGMPTEEPADLVLTSSFELLLATARGQADIVLAIVPESTAPEFPAVAERLDGLVAVARVFKTRHKDLEPAINSGRLLGWVLLTHRRDPSSVSRAPKRLFERLRNRTAAREPAPSTEVASTPPASVKAARHRAQRRNTSRRSQRDLRSTIESQDNGEVMATDQSDDRSLG